MVAWRLPRRFGRRRSRCGRAWRQPIRSAEAMPPLTGPRCLRFERRPLHRKSRRVLMTTPLSQDLRDGLRGASMRVAPRGAARRFEVSPSAAIKLMRRVRKTGSTAPAKIGGHRRRSSKSTRITVATWRGRTRASTWERHPARPHQANQAILPFPREQGAIHTGAGAARSNIPNRSRGSSGSASRSSCSNIGKSRRHRRT